MNSKSIDHGGYMKNLLSIALIASLALAVPAKAEPYDSRLIAGAALVTAGLIGAFCSAKLGLDYSAHKSKLDKYLSSPDFNSRVYDARRKTNDFWRKGGSYGTGILAFSATTAGLVLLSLGLSNKQTYTLPQMFNKKC